ncbi:MAG: hypothetical protein B6241_01815 [Spirochaetaceae bacterium 4572_59]|nr:MAG: hypothetical protein B6241_01815 [Spirochaetaceae bacterium 4572_59]
MIILVHPFSESFVIVNYYNAFSKILGADFFTKKSSRTKKSYPLWEQLFYVLRISQDFKA